MILLIDVGNTRTKLSLLRDNASSRDPQTVAYAHQDSAQIGQWLNKLAEPIQQAYGINVAHAEITAQLETLLLPLGIQVQWLDSSTPYAALNNDYATPTKLGPDRWFSAIGLVDTLTQPTPAIVHASFGTATTVDTIYYDAHAARYHFAGGLILPGPQLMHESLALHTAKLGLGEGEMHTFPTETRSAITTGIAAAQAGAVMRQWMASHKLMQHKPLLICSGGGRHYVEAELQSALQQHCFLTQQDATTLHWRAAPALDGLAAIARQQQS